MRIARVFAISASILAFTSSPGSAQESRFHVNLGGGPIFNAGDLGDHFASGWGPVVGVTVEAPNRRIGLQFEYAFSRFDIKDGAPVFGATDFSAKHQTHQLDFNVVVNLSVPRSRPIVIHGSARPGIDVRPYLVAGPGMYHRSVEITRYVGSGVICDPYWYVCDTYQTSEVTGSRGGWDVGFNVGGGVAFGLGSAEFYIETRFHHVLGPDIRPPATPAGTAAGTGGSANGSYYPLTFGFRW